MDVQKFRKIPNLILSTLVCSSIYILSSGFILGQDRSDGWWIIVGTFPTTPWERQKDDLESMNARASRCNVELFNDFSQKFRGFNPGYNVFVVGAFGRKSEAEEKIKSIRNCFPDAYLKYGEYLGE